MACFFISLKTSNYLFRSQFIVDCFCNLEKITDENIKQNIKEKMLYYEFDILDGKTNIIPTNKLLNKIGFPDNWRDIINID